MRYWDASALIPLVVAEPDSEQVRGWLAEDDHIATWAWTLTEIASAVERRTCEGSLSRQQRRESLDRFAALARSWDEVTDVLAVRSRRTPCWRGILCGQPTRVSLVPRYWFTSSSREPSRSSAWTSGSRWRRNARAFGWSAEPYSSAPRDRTRNRHGRRSGRGTALVEVAARDEGADPGVRGRAAYARAGRSYPAGRLVPGKLFSSRSRTSG